MNLLKRRAQLDLYRPVASTDRDWSEQQLAVFDWFNTGSGNLAVRARAGTGKTTAIIEGIARAPERTILLAAFNAKIAEELKQRLTNPRAQAKTLHSLGSGIVRGQWEIRDVDRKRGGRLAAKALESAGIESLRDVVRYVDTLVGRAKQTLVDGFEQMMDTAVDLDLFPEKNWTCDAQQLAQVALEAMKLSHIHDGTIDFNDMIYLPIACQWAKPKFDLVVIDEAQDMNASQLRLAQLVSKGRICVVGDDRQAIYAFRGADSGSLDRLKRELSAKELGLTITYRCPRSVVELAAELVPDFRAAPNAPEGNVEGGIDVPAYPTSTIKHEAVEGDFVVSRTNAPLARLCLGMLREGKRAKIEGRNVGEQIIDTVRRMRACSIPELLEHINEWEEEQVEYLRAEIKDEARREAKIFDLRDYLETMRTLATSTSSMEELDELVTRLFADEIGSDSIVCSTVHRVKGREAQRVFLLANTFYPGGRKNLEEENIHYVAMTRSKETLTWCGDARSERRR
jgi:superfamily I DNA/RNA helicase